MKETKSDRWDAVKDIWRIIERLRSENGCPWDRKQTPESIQTYLVEESHEAAAAIRAGRAEDAAEELGDVLFMTLFLVYLYETRGDFNLEQVCGKISEKMIRRHPHVFGETSVSSTEEVKDNWEKIKAGEKRASGKTPDPIPESLPALMRAYRILSRRSQKEKGDHNNDLGKQVLEFARQGKKLSRGIEDDSFEWQDEMAALFVRLVDIARLKGFRAEDILHNYLRKNE